jgi:hypothetical protein
VRSERLALLSDRPFGRFFLAHTLSFLGTRVSYLALPLLIFELTGSALQTALLLVLETVPYLLFGLFAGAVADRVDRRRLMVACDLTGFALMASIPLAAAFDALVPVQVMAVAAAAATCFVWFDAANFGALSSVVGRPNLVLARSLTQAVDSILMIAGPAIGGVLVAAFGAAITLTVDALSYLASAILLLTVRRPFQAGRTAVPRTYRTDIAEGLRYLWNHRIVRALTLMGVGNSLAAGALVGLLVVFADTTLAVHDDRRIGLLFAAGAVGSFIASLGLPWLRRRLPAAAVGLYGITAALPLYLGVTATPTYPLALVLYLLWNAAYSCTVLNGIIYRQQVVPNEMQGRVNVVARMIAWGGQPAGALIAGAVAETTNVRTALLTIAAAVLLTVAAAWVGPLRTEARATQHDSP